MWERRKHRPALAKVAACHQLARDDTNGQVAAGLGFEPTEKSPFSLDETEAVPQIVPQAAGPDSIPSEVVEGWPKLSKPIQAAILALVRTASTEGGRP